MKLLEILKEQLAVEKPQSGLGAEIIIDPKTAEKSLKYFIVNGAQRTAVPKAKVEKSPIYNKFERAVQAIGQLNVRRKFAVDDDSTLDVMATQTAPGKWKIVATSDDGQLQLTWDFATSSWKKK